MATKANKNNNAFSLEAKVSAPCTINAATPMAIIVGILARRVLYPMIIKRGQIASAITTKTVVAISPIPIGSDFIKVPCMRFKSLGMP